MKKKVLLALAGVVLVLAIALGIVGCTSSNEERVNDKQEVMTEKDDSKEAVEDEKSLLEEKKTDRESDEEVEEETEDAEPVNESKETKTSNTSKKEDSSDKKTSSSDNNSKKAETKDETHTHSWEPVYKEVDNGYYEKVLVKAAWTEEVTKTKKVGAEICKGCGHAMFTPEDIDAHCEPAMLAGNTKCGTYKSGYVDVEVTETVEHPAEYANQWVPVIEKVLTGYKCSCGTTK